LEENKEVLSNTGSVKWDERGGEVPMVRTRETVSKLFSAVERRGDSRETLGSQPRSSGKSSGPFQQVNKRGSICSTMDERKKGRVRKAVKPDKRDDVNNLFVR